MEGWGRGGGVLRFPHMVSCHQNFAAKGRTITAGCGPSIKIYCCSFLIYLIPFLGVVKKLVGPMDTSYYLRVSPCGQKHAGKGEIFSTIRGFYPRLAKIRGQISKMY